MKFFDPELNSQIAEDTANWTCCISNDLAFGHQLQIMLCKLSLAFWVYLSKHLLSWSALLRSSKIGFNLKGTLQISICQSCRSLSRFPCLSGTCANSPYLLDSVDAALLYFRYQQNERELLSQLFACLQDHDCVILLPGQSSSAYLQFELFVSLPLPPKRDPSANFSFFTRLRGLVPSRFCTWPTQSIFVTGYKDSWEIAEKDLLSPSPRKVVYYSLFFSSERCHTFNMHQLLPFLKLIQSNLPDKPASAFSPSLFLWIRIRNIFPVSTFITYFV